MTDKTLDELKAEVSKLNDKITQVIGEKRRVQSERDELAATLETLQAENKTTQDRLEDLTIHAPRIDTVSQIAANGMTDLLWREINHNFDIERTDDGDILKTKAGEPVTAEGKPVTLSVEGIKLLSEHKLMDGISSMIKGNGATGGGALGNNGSGATQQTPQAPQRMQFGMR